MIICFEEDAAVVLKTSTGVTTIDLSFTTSSKFLFRERCFGDLNILVGVTRSVKSLEGRIRLEF